MSAGCPDDVRERARVAGGRHDRGAVFERPRDDLIVFEVAGSVAGAQAHVDHVDLRVGMDTGQFLDARISKQHVVRRDPIDRLAGHVRRPACAEDLQRDDQSARRDTGRDFTRLEAGGDARHVRAVRTVVDRIVVRRRLRGACAGRGRAAGVVELADEIVSADHLFRGETVVIRIGRIVLGTRVDIARTAERDMHVIHSGIDDRDRCALAVPTELVGHPGGADVDPRVVHGRLVLRRTRYADDAREAQDGLQRPALGVDVDHVDRGLEGADHGGSQTLKRLDHSQLALADHVVQLASRGDVESVHAAGSIGDVHDRWAFQPDIQAERRVGRHLRESRDVGGVAHEGDGRAVEQHGRRRIRRNGRAAGNAGQQYDRGGGERGQRFPNRVHAFLHWIFDERPVAPTPTLRALDRAASTPHLTIEPMTFEPMTFEAQSLEFLYHPVLTSPRTRA